MPPKIVCPLMDKVEEICRNNPSMLGYSAAQLLPLAATKLEMDLGDPELKELIKKRSIVMGSRLSRMRKRQQEAEEAIERRDAVEGRLEAANSSGSANDDLAELLGGLSI
jgi:hypothetical protein